MGRKKRKVAEQEAPSASGGADGGSATVTASRVKAEMAPSPAVVGAIPRKQPAVANTSAAPPAVAAAATANANANVSGDNNTAAANTTPSIHIKSATMATAEASNNTAVEDYLGEAKPSSQYGLHSHAGDLVEDDVYVSDGSLESSDDDDETMENGENENESGEGAPDKTGGGKKKKVGVELVITTSRMGLMRRGGLSSLLGQPQMNRTWVRSENKDDKTGGEGAQTEGTTDDHPDAVKNESEDDENLDPAQRLALQQRKIELAKQEARHVESSENAGRDPCLFSKRTAFDIRMDQIDEKPWDKPEGDPTDYFNYGMDESDWLEYSEGQLAVRQELTDASKQKRLPDPGIVPVVPRAPRVQGDRVAVRTKKATDAKEEEGEGEEGDAKAKEEEEDDEDGGMEMGVELGPLGKAKKDEGEKQEGGTAKAEAVPEATARARNEKVVGGAWGAGAAQDSVLLRLIREQSGGGGGPGGRMGGRPGPPGHMGGPPMGGPPPRGPPMGGPPGHFHPGPRFGGPDGGGQWPRDRFPNQFHRQGSGGGGGGGPGYNNNPPPPPQPFQRGPPPGQFQPRGGGPGGPGGQGGPPQGRYPPPPQGQGHWGGGGGAPPPGGGRGFPDPRGGPPPPHRGGAPPNNAGGPPPGGGWDGRKRPRSEYGGGGDPRGDPRRGRW